MNIGENIKKLREEKGISQNELAKQVGITQSMVAQIERGTKTITVPLGKKIADVFECTVDDLITA